MNVPDTPAGRPARARASSRRRRPDDGSRSLPAAVRAVGARRLSALRRACTPLAPMLPHAALATAACFAPGRAWAHVKWFASYDVAAPPAPISGVLAPPFSLVFAGFVLLVFGGFLLDRLAARRPGPGASGPEGREELEERLLRAGTGAFFMALFATGGVILTPELKTGAEWPAWLQLGIAASMLSARTCVLGAAGILALYGYGAALYGAFHIADYPVFLGLAAYMALTSSASERLRSLRMPAVYVSICASLMWGAVEKWAYPCWFYPLLEAHPHLAFGLPPELFVAAAGFVEFALAFHILFGLGLLRLGIAGLGAIFAAAVLDFGKLDAVGHLPIFAALAAMFVHGPTPLHRRLHDARRGLLAEGRRAGLAFAAAVGLFFSAYYGLQRAEYGGAGDHEHAGGGGARRLAALETAAHHAH